MRYKIPLRRARIYYTEKWGKTIYYNPVRLSPELLHLLTKKVARVWVENEVLIFEFEDESVEQKVS
jgi:hypothetical protein